MDHHVPQQLGPTTTTERDAAGRITPSGSQLFDPQGAGGPASETAGRINPNGSELFDPQGAGWPRTTGWTRTAGSTRAAGSCVPEWRRPDTVQT
jgi:hypothetical protein